MRSHIAKFFCNAKLGRYRGVADIEQASPRSIWLKLPTRAIGAFADILHPFRYSPRDTLR
jgi:hypothetical protein